VLVPKFKEVLMRHENLALEVFTPEERERCQAFREPFRHLAGRFAAKEACLKALGLGLQGHGPSSSLREIEVASTPSGIPSLRLKGWIARIGSKRNVTQSTVSISHSGDYCIAMVVLLLSKDSERKA